MSQLVRDNLSAEKRSREAVREREGWGKANGRRCWGGGCNPVPMCSGGRCAAGGHDLLLMGHDEPLDETAHRGCSVGDSGPLGRLRWAVP